MINIERNQNKMFVINRKGESEPVSFDIISNRIKKLSNGLSTNYLKIAHEVINQMTNNIKTIELDDLSAQISYEHVTEHPDYGVLASRLFVSNIHKMTTERFSEACTFAQYNYDMNGNISSLLDDKIYSFIMNNAGKLDSMINHDRDYIFDYTALFAATNTYLISLDLSVINNRKDIGCIPSDIKKIMANAGVDSEKDFNDMKEQEFIDITKVYGLPLKNRNRLLIDRPQYAFMRQAIEFYYDEVEDTTKVVKKEENEDQSNKVNQNKLALDMIKECYEYLSLQYFTHPTPTIINACKTKRQMLSCFILGIDDSLDHIYDTIKSFAMISKHAGGIGFTAGNIRSDNSYIKGTNGTTSGVRKMLKVVNETVSYVDQSGVRPGAAAVYLQPEHPDILKFLSLKSILGNPNEQARELFYGIWSSDLFMRKCLEDDWFYLMCPKKCPGLTKIDNEEYEELYNFYVSKGLYTEKIRAKELLIRIVKSMYETGGPYFCSKDASNRKSNQHYLGTIESSNLCTEINEYYDYNNPACCVLASVCLNRMVKYQNLKEECGEIKLFKFSDKKDYKKCREEISEYIDFDRLATITSLMVRNLNKVIEHNYYPVDIIKNNNFKYRPLGIGVQGLATLLATIRVPYDSSESKIIQSLLFETMYYNALQESCLEAEECEKYYEGFRESPLGKGSFQFDLWGNSKTNPYEKSFDYNTLTLDWSSAINSSSKASLKDNIQKYGTRNSLLLALMPTVGTSMWMGNSQSECFEPFHNHIYQRKTMFGTQQIITTQLIKDLQIYGLWNDSMKHKIIEQDGSIRNIKEIPEVIRQLYKSKWDIKDSVLIDLAVIRGYFVCQSQSLNFYVRSKDVPIEETISRIYSLIINGWKKGLKTCSYYIRSQEGSGTNKLTSTFKNLEDPIECKISKNEDGQIVKSCCSG